MGELKTIIHVVTHNLLLPTPTLPAVSYLFTHKYTNMHTHISAKQKERDHVAVSQLIQTQEICVAVLYY